MASTKVNRVRPENLRELAYKEIRRAVLHGNFEPGDTITIRELAAEMGLGLTPVREGVQLLASHGAIEFLPNRSVRVTSPTAEDLRKLFEARILIESHTALLAVPNLRPRDLAALESMMDDMLTAIEKVQPELGLKANFDFHFLIYQAAQSIYLLEAIERLWLRVGPLHIAPYRASPAERQAYAATASDHRVLIDALRAGDGKKVADAITRVLRHSCDWYVKYCVGENSIFAKKHPGSLETSRRGTASTARPRRRQAIVATAKRR